MIGVAEMEGTAVLTKGTVHSYLEYLEEQGRTASTIQTYGRSLHRLLEWLGEDGELNRESLREWRESMLGEGYSPSTVNTSLSVANGCLDYLGRRDLQFTAHLELPERQRPELSRKEYLAMLAAARNEGNERVYLLIKLFAQTGIGVQELKLVTVEAVKAGEFSAGSGEQTRRVRMHKALRRELLSYCGRSGVSSGAVFVGRSGKPLNRTAVSDMIRGCCERAGLRGGKANPRCLRRMYQDTVNSIRQKYVRRMELDYADLLDAEQDAAAGRGGNK